MLRFGDICIEKRNFQSTKKLISIIQVDIYGALVLNWQDIQLAKKV